MKLDIGSGGAVLDGWTSVDLYFPADVKASMLDLPFDDDTVEAINCCHALEHVTKADGVAALIEFRRVLMPGGSLTVEVPDMLWGCRQYLDGRENRPDAYRVLYGEQDREGMSHLAGYDAETLAKAVLAAGFPHPEVRPEWSHGCRSLIARTGK